MNTRIKAIYILLIVFITLGVVVGLVLYELGVFDVRSLTISTLNICTQKISGEISNKDYCGSKFSKNMRRLFICGTIVSDKPSSGYYEDLNILVYRDGETRPIFNNNPGEKFSKGEFCEEAIFPVDIETGFYSVKIFYFRDLVAESQFELR